MTFSATQLYGSCDDPIPYDIFSGRAEPASTVTISSAYGSGTTTADGSGPWERKVGFAVAPRGSTFAVTASGAGGSQTFDFAVGQQVREAALSRRQDQTGSWYPESSKR